MTHEEAREILRGMSLKECMEMWNESAVDHYCRYMEMREIGDLDWWSDLARELGAWGLVDAVLSSGDRFNTSDKYFFFDQDEGYMISFSTKQELIEKIEEDFFIDTIMNYEED